jgi:hypothetical protein
LRAAGGFIPRNDDLEAPDRLVSSGPWAGILLCGLSTGFSSPSSANFSLPNAHPNKTDT